MILISLWLCSNPSWIYQSKVVHMSDKTSLWQEALQLRKLAFEGVTNYLCHDRQQLAIMPHDRQVHTLQLGKVHIRKD